MLNKVFTGVWPTLVTPFTDADKIDHGALEEMVNWYYSRGVDGLFAVCQSSEMFSLSLEERVELASAVVRASGGRLPVIASGHVSDTVKEQIEEIKRISDTGTDAFVLVSNRLAQPDEKDEAWMRNAEFLLKSISNVQFGIYECPYPYKRLMSAELLKWCAETGRFVFLKDTCCDNGQIKAKVQAVKGKTLKLFNANSATLLQSLMDGASGYSGVMANFHPQLYAWLMENWDKEILRAQELQDFLGTAALIAGQVYPVNAKYFLKLEGLRITLNSRIKNPADFLPFNKLEVEQLSNLTNMYTGKYPLKSKKSRVTT